MVVGLGRCDFVLDGHPPPPPQRRGRSPQFSAHVYCGQTAGCIKVALCMEVGLGTGHIVLDGDPATLPISIVVKRLDRSRCHLVWM